VDGNPRKLLIGHSRVTLRLENEAWWINPNLASPALLEVLLRVNGSDPESARHLADAIGEWVGSTPAPRPPNVLQAEYHAAGLDYGPPAAPLETLDELGRVLGMTPAALAEICPHLTLFGPPQPNPGTTDPDVATALASVAAIQPAVSPNQPPPDVVTTRITAAASGPNNAEASRSAIIRFGPALPRGYEVLAWVTGFEVGLGSPPKPGVVSLKSHYVCPQAHVLPCRFCVGEASVWHLYSQVAVLYSGDRLTNGCLNSTRKNRATSVMTLCLVLVSYAGSRIWRAGRSLL
jgi:hypothetical protein